MPVELIALIGQGGLTGGVIWAMVYLHRSAIKALEQRADDWRAAAEMHGKRADEATATLIRMLPEAVRPTPHPAPVRDVAGPS